FVVPTRRRGHRELLGATRGSEVRNLRDDGVGMAPGQRHSREQADRWLAAESRTREHYLHAVAPKVSRGAVGRAEGLPPDCRAGRAHGRPTRPSNAAQELASISAAEHYVVGT